MVDQAAFRRLVDVRACNCEHVYTGGAPLAAHYDRPLLVAYNARTGMRAGPPVEKPKLMIVAAIVSTLLVLGTILFDQATGFRDWVSLLGTVLGVLGFAFTLQQLVELRNRTGAIEETTKRTEASVRKFISADDLAQCRRFGHEAGIYARQNDLSAAHVRLQDFCETLTRVSQAPGLFSDKEAEDLASALSDVRRVASELEVHLQEPTAKGFSSKKLVQFVAPIMPILTSATARMPYDNTYPRSKELPK